MPTLWLQYVSAQIFMKILIVLFALLLSSPTKAQKFYSKNELNVSWKYWSNYSDWEYLINNGTKIKYSCVPNFNYQTWSINNPIEIIATYCRNNKFIIISFSEERDYDNYSGIRIRDNSYDVNNITKLCEDLQYAKQFSWYEIDFDNIVYDSFFDRVMIPIGVDYNGYHHAICIGFSDTQSLNSVTIDDTTFNEENVEYYNIKGEQIDINSANDKIIIKTDGKKSVKFLK